MSEELLKPVLTSGLTVSIRSPKDFDQTCKAIEEVVGKTPEKGWGFPFEKWEFYKVFESRNLIPDGFKRLRVYFLCNASVAKKLIEANNSMVGIMPCSWAVYEKDDGVYIAKLNMQFLQDLYDSPIKEAFKEVEEAENRMLRRVLS